MTAFDFISTREIGDAIAREATEEVVSKLASGRLVAKGRTQSSLRPVELSESVLREFRLPAVSGAFLSTYSDDSIDRTGDVVVQRGGDLEEYRANPVLLWNHNRDAAGERTNEPPIGKTLSIFQELNRGKGSDGERLPDRTRGVHVFHRETPRSDEIARLWASGTLRTHSIGFMPRPNEMELMAEPEQAGDPRGIRFKVWTLREDSIVFIPANKNAMAELSDGEIVRSIGALPLYRRDLESWLDLHPVDSVWEFEGRRHKVDSTLRSVLEGTFRGVRKAAPTVDTIDIEALLKRVATLETKIEALAERPEPPATEPAQQNDGPIRFVIEG